MQKTLSIDTPRVFLPLLADDMRYRAAYGGRGSGKSHFFGEKLVEDCLINPGLRGVCIREVQKSLKESAYRLIADKIDKLGVSKEFRILRDMIITPGDGVILFQGMQDHTAETIKSLEGFGRAWCEEAQTMSSRSLEMLRPTIRSPGSELWFSWNPRSAKDPVDNFFRGVSGPPKRTAIVKANYTDNPWFPPELEEERQHDRIHSPDRYAHIWLGEYEPQAVGAIWNLAQLHSSRIFEAPTMSRIVVSVDPAVSNETGSDEHGIFCAGIGEDKRGYALEDGSMKGTPRQWAERAVAMYDKWDADAIIVERNQGGDMVKQTIMSVRPGIKVIEVTATRGKHVRAEPISALYEFGQISHVGSFPELEEQMCMMTSSGYNGHGSPDRVDALVWAFTELFPSIIDKTPKRKRRERSGGSWMS